MRLTNLGKTMEDKPVSEPLVSLKLTILLFAALFLPFILKFLSPKLEPYPAILLPSGATKFNLEKETLEARLLSIYGYNSQGELTEIEPKKLLRPLPVQYFNALAREEFGLSTKKYTTVQMKYLNKSFRIKRRVFSEEKREQCKLWLRKRLRGFGLSDSAIVIRYEVRDLDVDNGEEVSRRIKDEKIIRLR